MKKLIISLAAFSLTVSSSSLLAVSKSAVSKAIEDAEVSRAHAASVEGEWRDTGKILKNAKAALKEGKLDKALKLAHQAKRQGEHGYEQAASQQNFKMPSFMTSASGYATQTVSNKGHISETLKSVDVIHQGKQVTISRSTDKSATIPAIFTKVSRACPPFCVQPIKIAKGVETVGELEVLDYLKKISHGDNTSLVIDSRKPEWIIRGTIPGTVNIPWNKLVLSSNGAFPTESENKVFNDILTKQFGVRVTKDKKYDFRNAKNLVAFCNGAWCEQSAHNIQTLIDLGYPAYKLKWYRGGMQSWVSLGLTTVAP